MKRRYLSEAAFDELREKCGFRCNLCGNKEPFVGQPCQRLVQDHIYPVSKGGDAGNNIQPLCWRCNSRKSNKVPSIIQVLEANERKYKDEREHYKELFRSYKEISNSFRDSLDSLWLEGKRKEHIIERLRSISGEDSYWRAFCEARQDYLPTRPNNRKL